MTQRLPHFVLWKWRSAAYRTTYLMEHVTTAVWMLTKHGVPLENIVLVTDDAEGAPCRAYPLWSDYGNMPNISSAHLPSCYRRLKIFDPETTDAMGISRGERVVSLDLDMVILQDFRSLFARSEPFVGWIVPGTRHRRVMNGSMFMFTAGEMDWLWKGFNPEKSPRAALDAGYMGSDQGYMSHQLVQMQSTGGWSAMTHGVLSYSRDVVAGRRLPKNGRVVFFPGKHKPWDEQTRRKSDWILRYVPKPEELAAA